MKKTIKTAKEAKDAFIAEFASLACALNPCSQFYTGFQFVRQKIQVFGGEPIWAYIAHDNAMESTMIVPCDGTTPDIMAFKNVHVVKTVKNKKEALDSFIKEYGSLIRALNPASKAYMGFEFNQETINVFGEIFKAFVAFDTKKTIIFVVPIDGTIPSIWDYDDIKIVIRKK